LIAKNNR